MQQVGVLAERRLAALVPRHRDLVLLGIVDQAGPAGQVPFAPRGDDPDVRLEGEIGQLEADLVVALAGRAVGDRVGAGLVRDLDLAFGDQRPGDRGAEQVGPLIDRVGPEHREDIIAGEFLAQILDIDFPNAEHLGLAPRRLKLLALAEIGGECHHLAAVGVLQPAQDDGGVQPAGVGQHHFPDIALLGHRIGLGCLRASAARDRAGTGVIGSAPPTSMRRVRRGRDRFPIFRTYVSCTYRVGRARILQVYNGLPTSSATRLRKAGSSSASNQGLRETQPRVRQLGCGVGR